MTKYEGVKLPTYLENRMSYNQSPSQVGSLNIQSEISGDKLRYGNDALHFKLNKTAVTRKKIYDRKKPMIGKLPEQVYGLNLVPSY